MIQFSDTTFRAYKKKNGQISLHARGILLVHTSSGFSLSAYLRDMHCWICLPGKPEHKCNSISIGDELLCEFDGMSMMHDFHIETVLPFHELKTCVADVKIMYHLAFVDPSLEEPKFLNMRVPVIKKFRERPARNN